MDLEIQDDAVMKNKKQLSLAQALGDLSKIEPDKLLGRKVFFVERTEGRPSQKEIMQGTIISLSETAGYVIIRKRSFCVVSRSLGELYDDPEGIPVLNIRRKKPVVLKKKKQLSLAQALGDLSKTDPDKLVGRKVVFQIIKRNRLGTRPRKVSKQGIIFKIQSPGFVLIKDEGKGVYSRDLSNVWGDVLE
jgi:ribosomal protein L35AE/L33A